MIQMITYKEPDYEAAQKKAYDTILDSRINTLPINLKTIVNQFHNLHLQRYSVFAWENGMTIDEVSDFLDSDEGCLWRRNDNQYIVLYNDTIQSKERVRFTIAHEIGHYVLKHHEYSNKTKVSRYSLTVAEDAVLEKEANYFAKRMLAPLPLVYDFISLWNRISPDLIMDIFDVSYTVSNYIINDLNRARQYGIARVSHDINSQFTDFVHKIKHARWCKNCNFTFSCNNANHCPICGVTDLINNSLFIIRGNKDMLYPSFELDDEMRVIQCPRCENEDVSGNYCKVCAEYLFNICTGLNPNEDNSYYFQNGIQWGNHETECESSHLDGNARFCHECGSTSSFFEEELLKRWDEEPEEEKQLVSTISNPFASTDNSPPDISDDDLPF